MKKLKEMMKGKRIRRFKTSQGEVKVEKMLAHYFEDDENMTEHFFYIYEITKNY